MSVYRMNDEQILKFIEMYREEELLWNSETPLYKNRGARQVAVQRIAQEMEMKGFGPNEVVQKVKNIRSAYCQELKKVTADEFYQPSVVWFTTLDSFLKRHVQQREPYVNLRDKGYTQTTPFDGSEEETSPNRQSQVFKFTNEKIKLEDCRTIQQQLPILDLIEQSPVMRKKLKTRDKLNDDVGAGYENQEDEFDAFGRNVASHLRKLPLRRAMSAECTIQQVLTEERINAINEKHQATSSTRKHNPLSSPNSNYSWKKSPASTSSSTS